MNQNTLVLLVLCAAMCALAEGTAVAERSLLMTPEDNVTVPEGNSSVPSEALVPSANSTVPLEAPEANVTAPTESTVPEGNVTVPSEGTVPNEVPEANITVPSAEHTPMDATSPIVVPPMDVTAPKMPTPMDVTAPKMPTPMDVTAPKMPDPTAPGLNVPLDAPVYTPQGSSSSSSNTVAIVFAVLGSVAFVALLVFAYIKVKQRTLRYDSNEMEELRSINKS
eukprot:TRINITY_DN832_c0_g1_i1.p1 TRINITY_DN832_c0_g1~~TRINITY_DN832_c0_g1_i1.p1  ORF type:complete len:223 (+),score=42.34 TRINITY_DN832_c0_g1_i1:52-720(+)